MVDYDSKDYLKSVDAYWRAANYLSVGQLFLMKNPLLREKLVAEDVKLSQSVTGARLHRRTSSMLT